MGFICKEKLNKQIDDYCGFQKYLVPEGIREIINNAPEVSEASIITKFANWLVDNNCLVSPNEMIVCVDDVVENYLSDMEDANEN